MEEARLWKKYKEEIVPEMMREFHFSNPLRVPRIEKVVVNMGVGEGIADSKAVQAAADELALITGQRPVITRARKSVAGFKLREGMEVGCRVTLRGRMMYEFIDRMINVALPRIRDFRGLSPDSFDEHGNFSFGLVEQIVFPEVDVDKSYRTQGMDITIVTTIRDVGEARELLRLFGMPFKRGEGES
ncbi:MAG: 50S ribosomal protein L5 [Candidatus Euphemobacter frigidus]|nr:50S ribosomal protein L5 [Candidatus Euphemobacter frigidus]MDP8276192.1 50S ribosomal protein L5 [Candidatus Euphemobacter frigidus]